MSIFVLIFFLFFQLSNQTPCLYDKDCEKWEVCGTPVDIGTCRNRTSSDPDKSVCKSPDCNGISNRYLLNLNRSIKPCENFYEFVCGKYPKPKKYQRRVNIFQEMTVDLDLKLKEFLEENSEDLGILKIFYGSCMTSNNLEVEDLLEIFGNSSENPFFQILIEPSLNDNTKYMMHFEPPELFLKEIKSYQKPENIAHLKKFMLKILKDHSDLEIQEIIDFEKNLAAIIKEPSEKLENHASYRNLMSLEDFNDNFRNIGFDFGNTTLVNIYDSGFFEKLNELLGRTTPKILENYKIWRFIAEFLKYLNPQEFFDFERKIYGFSSTENPIWAICLNELKEQLPVLLAKKYFKTNEQKKKEIRNLINNIEKSARNLMNSTDSPDKNVIMKRLGKMWFDQWSYPKFELDIGKEKVLLKPGKFLENLVILRKYNRRSYFSKLEKPVEVYWHNSVLSINAYYKRRENSVILPPGLLTYPMFSQDVPPFVNYGSIGFIISHEIAHAFDDKGASYDENSRLLVNSNSILNFPTDYQCLMSQYQNNSKILTESVADNIGIRIAFDAYHEQWQNSVDQRSLTDFQNMSGIRMFFVAFASTFCHNVNPDYSRNDEHAFGAERINTVLRNLPEFSETFGCSKEKKCKIW